MKIRFCIGLTLAICTACSAAAATVYTYDDLGRLSSACYDNGKKIIYSYDPAGNRAQVVIQVGACS